MQPYLGHSYLAYSLQRTARHRIRDHEAYIAMPTTLYSSASGKYMI